MLTQIVMAVGLLSLLFVLFLVLSKAIGAIDNSLYKLEYLLRKECDIKLEALEMKYKIKAADKKFNEAYDMKHVKENIQKEIDETEKNAHD